MRKLHLKNTVAWCQISILKPCALKSINSQLMHQVALSKRFQLMLDSCANLSIII